MAHYCPYCGRVVASGSAFCPSCGRSQASVYRTATPSVGSILGTLVAVNLIGGLTRQLYYYNGRYYLDPYCRIPYLTPHFIHGPHRMIGRPPVAPPPPPPPVPRPPVGARPPVGGPSPVGGRPPMGGGRPPMGGGCPPMGGGRR